MSSKKSAGRSGGAAGKSGAGNAGKSGGGNVGKSVPKPSSQGVSGGKPNPQVISGAKPSNSVDTKSARVMQESLKGKGNGSGVKLQDAVADNKAGKVEVGAEAHGVPSGGVKVKSSDFKSRNPGDKTEKKLNEPN